MHTESRGWVSGRVSIITPTYNRSSLLDAAVRSVLAQTYPNWELVIVDDGSTDDTAEMMQRHLSDPRITYQQQANAGQSAARNRALQVATGEFVMFLDSDNTWTPRALETLVNEMTNHPEAGVIGGNTHGVEADGIPSPYRGKQRYFGRVTGELIRSNFVDMNSTMVRRAALDAADHFDESLRSAEDYDLWLRLSLHCQFHFVDVHITDYRLDGDRISKNEVLNFDCNERLLRRFIAANGDLAAQWPLADAWSAFYSRRSRSLFSSRERGMAIQDALLSIRHAPTRLRGWRTLGAVMLKPLPRD